MRMLAYGRDGNRAGIPRPRRGLAPHRGKIPAPTGMGTGTGIEINPRAGMGMGTGVNFHPVPVPVTPFVKYSISIPTFPSPVGKNPYSYFFLLNFSCIILYVVKVMLHKLVKL